MIRRIFVGFWLEPSSNKHLPHVLLPSHNVGLDYMRLRRTAAFDGIVDFEYYVEMIDTEILHSF